MKAVKRSIRIYEITFVSLNIETNEIVETKTIETTIKPTMRYTAMLAEKLHMIHVNTTSKDVDVELPLDVFYDVWKEYTAENDNSTLDNGGN